MCNSSGAGQGCALRCCVLCCASADCCCFLVLGGADGLKSASDPNIQQSFTNVYNQPALQVGAALLPALGAAAGSGALQARTRGCARMFDGSAAAAAPVAAWHAAANAGQLVRRQLSSAHGRLLLAVYCRTACSSASSAPATCCCCGCCPCPCCCRPFPAHTGTLCRVTMTTPTASTPRPTRTAPPTRWMRAPRPTAATALPGRSVRGNVLLLRHARGTLSNICCRPCQAPAAPQRACCARRRLISSPHAAALSTCIAQYTGRFNDMRWHSQNGSFNVPTGDGRLLDIVTLDTSPFIARYKAEPWFNNAGALVWCCRRDELLSLLLLACMRWRCEEGCAVRLLCVRLQHAAELWPAWGKHARLA